MSKKEDNIFDSELIDGDLMSTGDTFDKESLIGETIHLLLDDDTELDTVIIAAFYVDAYEDLYIALLPLVADEADEEDSEVFLYRIAIDEDGTSPLLGSIESDEEYEAVSQVFYEEMERLEEEADAAESMF